MNHLQFATNATPYGLSWRARLDDGVVELNAAVPYDRRWLESWIAGTDGGELWGGWQQGYPTGTDGMDGGDVDLGSAGPTLPPQHGDGGRLD